LHAMVVEILTVLTTLLNKVSWMISRYTMFWVVLLISKLAFSFYAEVHQFHKYSMFCFIV